MEKEHWKRAGSRGYKRISKFFHLQGMLRNYERELINLFSASAKSKGQRLSGKVLLAEKLLDAKEHLLQEREKAVETFRSQETYHRDALGSKLSLLETKTDAQNEALRRQVEDVSVRIKEITESKLNLLESKVSLVESKVDFRNEDVKKRVEDLSAQVKEMAESNLNSLQSKLTLLETRTEAQTEALRKQVENLSVRVKEMAESNVIQLESRLNPLDSKITLLEAKADAQNETLRRQMEDLAGRLKEMAESNLGPLQSKLALVETKVDTQNETLRKQVEDLSVRVKEMTESNVTHLESRLSPVESKLALLEAKADAQNEVLRRQGEDLVLRLKEIAESNLNLLGSKLDLLKSSTDLQYEDVKSRVEFVLLRLSLKERLKTVIYRLMKKIHLLVPVSIREKYHARYREIFFNRVIPGDKMAFEKTVSRPRRIQTPEVQAVVAEKEPERTEPPEIQETVVGREPERVEAPKVPEVAAEKEAEKTESQVVQEVAAEREPERVDPVQGFRKFKEEITRGLPLELEKFRAPCFPDLVSVVLPVYNQAYLVGDAIESVLSQTYPSMELIVVNDGSTDAIRDVLERYRGNPKVTIVDQENQKLPGALTNGFKQARGEFYTWTSADNWMYPKQLETQVEFFKNRPRTQMVYANYDLIDDQGRPLLGSDYCPGYQIPFGSNHIHLPQDPSELCVIRNNYIGPCFMYRSWVGRLIGEYDRFTFTMEDYDYWMIINDLFKTEHLGKADILYANRVHADSLTGRKKELRIVENTDRLMEFENLRQEFYRQKFKIYLIGNHDRLGEIKGLYGVSGHSVTQFRIPCENIEMEKGKAVGIWIYSSLERGLMARIREANPHAFFVMVQLVPEDIPDGDIEGKLDMVVSLVAKGLEHFQDRRWFFAEKFQNALYPILCKANVDLFRRTNRFQILW
jgi:glycosyltransferase involved in cell wall biosynthesis